MNNVLVLVDFTPTSYIALEQAVEIAKYRNLKVTLCHIPKSEKEANSQKFQDDLLPYMQKLAEYDVDHEFYLKWGDFETVVSEYVIGYQPEMVVLGTHGKVGIKQNLFGSHIFNFVQLVKSSILVVNDQTKPVKNGYQKILLPISSHDNFLLKVEEACNLLAYNGELQLFNLMKPGVSLNEKMAENIKKAQDYMDENGVKWKYALVESQTFSIGYSTETLKYAKEFDIDLIAIMTQTASIQIEASSIDKENIILNKDGIAVLCANHI